MDLLFWFSKSKSAGYGTIKLSIIVEGVEAQFSTGVKVLREHWKGNDLRIVGEGIKLQQCKETIEQIEARAMDAHKLFRIKKIMSTSKAVRAVLEHIRKLGRLHEEINLEDFDNAIQGQGIAKVKDLPLLELLKWFKENNQVKDQTKVTYEVRKGNIELYLSHIKAPKLSAMAFGLVHARNMSDFLTVEGELSKNYAIRHSEHLKTVFDLAVAKGVLDGNPLASYKPKRQKKRDLRHLSVGQLQNFRRMTITHAVAKEQRELEKARDIFLFLCFTGLHIGDYLGLKKEHFQVIDGFVWLIKERKKTFDEHLSTVEQKMHPRAIEIISKYGGQVEAVFEGKGRKRRQISGLPYMHDVKFNERLKVLEQMAGINMGLSSKMGRKTFAHICLNVHKYDLETTARMMGCEVKNIRDYAKVERERVAAVVQWQ